MESQWHFAFPTLNYIPKLEKYKKEGLPIYGALSRNKVGINRAIFRDGAIRICTGPSRRKRPFFSRRRDTLGTPTFKLAGFLRGRKKNKKRIARLREFPKSARWLPRDNPHEHRGVSAPSFRDGAIRRERQLLSWQVFCGVVKRTKSGSRDFVSFRSQPAGYPAITQTGIAA